MARWGQTILVLAALVLSTAVADGQSAQELFPLEPPDRSSPRATLQTFIDANAEGARALRRGAPGSEVIRSFERSDGSIDLGAASGDLADIRRTEAALLIYEVLTRVGLPEAAEIPNAEEAREADLTRWTVPHTEITLVRAEDGERVGEFLFSPETAARAKSFFERVSHLPPRPEFEPGTYDLYVAGPNLTVPYLWASDLPGWARRPWFENAAWKWLALGALLIAGFLLVRAASAFGHRIDRSLPAGQGNARPGLLLAAAIATAVPLTINGLLESVVGFRFEAAAVATKVLYFAAIAAGAVFVVLLCDQIARLISRPSGSRDRIFDGHLARIAGRIAGLAAALVVVVQGFTFLGFELAPLLAGLGVGGLALALAVRPTLENVIAGLTLFADRPLRIGDFCQFGDETGTVEAIGLRSTRIRRLDDKLVTVPNSELVQLQIQNFGQIRERLMRSVIGLRYETSPAQLRFLLGRLRAMLEEDKRVSEVRRNVRFLGFGDYSLDVEMFAYLRTSDWLEFRAIREDINLKIMEIVKEAGTGFAFPSQTAYLGRDGGLDPERTAAAEEEIAQRDRQLGLQLDPLGNEARPDQTQP